MDGTATLISGHPPWFVRGLVIASMCLVVAPARATLPEIHVTAERLDFAGNSLENVRAALGGEGQFRVESGRVSGVGEEIFGEGLAISGRIDSLADDGQALRLVTSLEALGLSGTLTLQATEPLLQIGWEARGQAVTALASVRGMPTAAAWVSRGRFDATAVLQIPQTLPASIQLQMDAQDVAFDSPAGEYAGEGVAFGLVVDWPNIGDQVLSLEGDIRQGELLLGDFYRDFTGAGMHYGAGLRWDDHAIDLSRLRLGDGGTVAFEGQARIATAAPEVAQSSTIDEGVPAQAANSWSLEANRLEMAFPGAYRRYLEPLAAPVTLDGLEVTGRVVWSGEWQDGSLVSGDLQVKDLSIVDLARQRFAVTGLEAHLRPGDYRFDSRLSWRGLLFGPINLGVGEARLDSEPGTVALTEPLVLDVLGGRVELSTLRVILPGSRGEASGQPDLVVRARISEIEMRQVSTALGWPEFAGTLSGDIPGVSLDEGVLSIDGRVLLDVFGGQVVLQNLGVERLFGVLPSLAADLAIEDLDLEQLTGTFSFGQIAGRLDGYVRDLRMLDWRPVAFDAWVGTPAGQSGTRDISRQAVNRLTTIGGGSATTALTGPLMRMFSSFSYRRLGLGCHLQNNVCSLRGLSEDEASVLILEGAGVPKITIRAFNRSVDWPQMVSNLLAISADNPVRTGSRSEADER